MQRVREPQYMDMPDMDTPAAAAVCRALHRPAATPPRARAGSHRDRCHPNGNAG